MTEFIGPLVSVYRLVLFFSNICTGIASLIQRFISLLSLSIIVIIIIIIIIVIVIIIIIRLRLRHIYTVNEKLGTMRLRTRGHDFTLPFVKYNFNKKNFIVRALYSYI